MAEEYISKYTESGGLTIAYQIWGDSKDTLVYVPGTIVLGIMLDTAGQQPVIIGSLDHIASKSETQKTDPTITNFPFPPDNEISKETQEDATVSELPYDGEKTKIEADKVDSFGIEIDGSSLRN